MELRSERRDGVYIIHLEGRLTAEDVEATGAAVGGALGEGGQTLVFDLHRLEFLCSAGLGVFVQAVREARARGGQVRFCGLRDEVRQVFDITGLSLRLELYPSLAEAVAGPAPQGKLSPE
jgi:anti-anti-sigma factor